jgi:hypothetical protein
MLGAREERPLSPHFAQQYFPHESSDNAWPCPAPKPMHCRLTPPAAKGYTDGSCYFEERGLSNIEKRNYL